MGTTLGIIGGSGLYGMEGLSNVEELEFETPFGEPSEAIVRGTLGETTLLFLPRHGRGHRILPHRINYRANVFAMKLAGAQQLLSVSAVGSLREQIVPGEMVIIDQFIDRTRQRATTFFEDYAIAAHVDFGDPIDAALAEALAVSVEAVGATVHRGGTYVCMEGPQFSTRAESEMYRGWGAAVIGMTNLTEAKLAREAELPYATLAMATDYDSWRIGQENVNAKAIGEVMRDNIATARSVIEQLVGRLPDPADSPVTGMLGPAPFTDPAFVDARARRELAPLIGKYLPIEDP